MIGSNVTSFENRIKVVNHSTLPYCVYLTVEEALVQVESLQLALGIPQGTAHGASGGQNLNYTKNSFGKAKCI